MAQQISLGKLHELERLACKYKVIYNVVGKTATCIICSRHFTLRDTALYTPIEIIEHLKEHIRAGEITEQSFF